LLNDPQRAHALADLDGAEVDLVLAVHDGDLVAALQLGDGALRHEQRALPLAGHRAHAAILARTQYSSGVREQSGQPDRTRLRIHLAVRDEELAFMRIRGPVDQYQLQFEALLCRATLCDGGIPPDEVEI